MKHQFRRRQGELSVADCTILAMKLLAATAATQGDRNNDFGFTVEGALVQIDSPWNEVLPTETIRNLRAHLSAVVERADRDDQTTVITERELNRVSIYTVDGGELVVLPVVTPVLRVCPGWAIEVAGRSSLSLR